MYSVLTNFQTTLAQSMTKTQLTLTLQNITLQGHAITSADYGQYLYFTINPGAANMEVVRAISNAAGVFTLDKRGLAWYGEDDDEITSFKFPHNSGEPVIVSNAKNVIAQMVNRWSNQEVGGDKQFTGDISFDNPIVIPITPTLPTHAGSKDYIDNAVSVASGNTSLMVTKNGSDPTLSIVTGKQLGYQMKCLQ